MYRDSVVWCGLCDFLIIKSLHHVVQCDVMHCYLWCGSIMPFYGRFWCSFYGLCGLCGLVNTPS